MNATESKTVLGRAVKFHGELAGSGDLLVEGEFEGVIRLAGSRVTIGPDAVVHAHVAAQDILVYGKLKGELRATGLLSLLDSAVVEGTVLAGRLAMEEGTSLRGSVDPTRAGEPLPPFSAKAATPSQQIAQAPMQLVAERYPAEVQKPQELFAGHAHVADDHDNSQFGHMPAGLAAAARRVDAAIPTGDTPDEPTSQLAGTEA